MFNGTFWQMKTAFFNTTAVSDAPDASFMLGKYNWTVKGDSAKCAKDNVYTKELKLTGCKEEQFTCDDGQCVTMEERCNQVSDYCKVLLFCLLSLIFLVTRCLTAEINLTKKVVN